MPEPRFFNRDLSQLAFNARVLAQAADESTPLLERIRFLCIFSGNMDEFFMKRLDPLRRSRGQGAPRSGEALNPGEILAAVRSETDRLSAERARLWTTALRPALVHEGIALLGWDELSAEEIGRAKKFFQAEVFPVLTPLAVDPAHPFPFLSNLSLSLGVRLRHPRGADPLFARIKIPDMLPQWVRVGPERGDQGLRLCRLTDVVAANLDSFFPEMFAEATTLFRVLRSADVESAAEEGDDEDRLDMVEEELRLRRMADIVAVQQPEGAEPWFQGLLSAELGLKPSDFHVCSGELNWQALAELAALPYAHLRFKPWVPLTPPAFGGNDEEVFLALRDQEHLIHLPYESFSSSIERLLQAAARDPQTLTIKIALYRMGNDSPLIPMLIEAAENGKQVVCVV
ncbi:MAG: polyphosphate kinase 1, partial [bacterium]